MIAENESEEKDQKCPFGGRKKSSGMKSQVAIAFAQRDPWKSSWRMYKNLTNDIGEKKKKQRKYNDQRTSNQLKSTTHFVILILFKSRKLK